MTERQEYIKTFSDVAIKAAKGTGLFPSLFLAQAILESANGKSLLASKYNNHFGIKASKGWTGKVIGINTREVINGQDVYVKANFRWYDNPLDSFSDRAKFLLQNPRYKNAGVFTAKTPEQQAEALQKAGYATDPNYAKLLSVIIGKYNLKLLDEIAKKKE